MPDPITNQLINSVWSDIQDAVTSGLAMEVEYGRPRPALDTVVVVSTEKLGGDQQWKHVPLDYAPPHVRVEQSGAAFDIMHHFDLSYHDLPAPDKIAIKDWAAAARQFELNLALHYYAEHTVCHPYTASQLFRADPGGWGQRRCVSFRAGGRTTIPDKWDRADLDCVVKIDDQPVDGMEGLLFRIAGGPYVRRPADLSLGWTPALHCAAELLLTEQLEFIDVTERNVYGIEVVTFGPDADSQ
jgi:hypothetical protein